MCFLVETLLTRDASLDDILNDCADHMHAVMRKNADKYAQVADPQATADTLGISAVMVQDMKGKM